MKKKLISLVLAGAMLLGMAGCAEKPGASEEGKKEDKGSKYELALITDVGTIDDKSFNQGSWEGLKKYADENDITCKYYKPSEKSDKACLTAIDLAVKGGAKVIVTPGFLFERPIFEAQTKYPDTKFVIIDAAPVEGENKAPEIKENVLSIFYAEEQAGYLAGYAAVEEGYRQLGFMGGIAVPAVIRFGYGFVQGADAAAWYSEGTECIFACGGGVGNSVMKAAEGAGKKVIGVDVDQSVESETVITSAMKTLSDSVYNAVASVYDGTFEGGKSITLGAADDGVQLPMETSKFEKFTQEKYDEIYAALKDGSIQVANDTAADDASKLPVNVVTVESIK